MEINGIKARARLQPDKPLKTCTDGPAESEDCLYACISLRHKDNPLPVYRLSPLDKCGQKNFLQKVKNN